VRGFVDNAAEALEQATTRALARDPRLARELGSLTAVNSAEHVILSQRSGGALQQQLEVDGLVVGGSTALLNSVKHTPTLTHVDDVVAAAKKLSAMLASRPDGSSVTTKPPGLTEALVGVSRILPFLSGNNFSAATEAACLKQGVGIVRPSGEGFVVVVAAVAAAANPSQ